MTEQQGFSSKLVSRVASYSAVSSLFETSKGYYTWGKENSKVVAFAESSLESGLSWLKPKFEVALQSQTYKTLEPLLYKADDLGVAALDTVETRANSIRTNYEVLGERVSKVKSATLDAIDLAQKKYVTPVDEYLNASLVARPYTIALGVTERVVDRLLPPEEQDQGIDETGAGPIARTTHLSKRVRQQAFAKLHNLSLRPPEKLRSMEQHTVDLIKYAAQTLDGAVASGAHLVAVEGPKEVRAKVTNATQSAVSALNSAVDVLVSHLPPKFKELKDEATAEPSAIFATVAQSGSRLLHDVSTTLQSYASKGEAAPTQLLVSTLGSVRKVLESLLSLAPHETKSSTDPIE